MKQQTIETQLAAQRLRELKAGEVCAYEDIHSLIGVDPQDGKGYGYVSSARAIVERELSCVFECVPNVGIKRLVPREVVNRGTRDLKHVRRSVRSGLRRQTTLVPFTAEMSPEERSKAHLNMSHFGMLEMATRPAAQKRIEQRVTEAARTLPPAEMMDLFAPKKKTEGAA